MKKNILTLFILIASNVLMSQNIDSKTLHIKGVQRNGRILLRWSATNYINWNVGNINGYVLQRYLVDKQNPQPVLQTTDTIKVLEFKKWEAVVDTSDNAAIAAQAIFGESFDMQLSNVGFLNMINIAREQENRFSFALLMAAQDFSLAKYMGLGYEIDKLDMSKKYLFKLYSLNNSLMVFDSAFVLVDNETISGLPIINYLNAQYKSGKVELAWTKSVNQDFYINYIIERSVDSVEFKPLTKNIFVSVETENNSGYFTYVDTISAINRYYYRIKGKDIFGLYGEYSTVSSVEVYNQLTVKPEIVNLSINKDNKIEVVWNYPQSDIDEVVGFQIFISQQINSGYTVVNKNILDNSERHYVIEELNPVTYVRIAAFDLGMDVYLSLPMMIQRADSTPPKAPQKVCGIVDSLGCMKLQWLNNTEEDIAGYRVFYSTNKNSEYTQITKELCVVNAFNYKFPLNWLNQQVYVKLLSEDIFYNHSEFSKIATIDLYDTIAPSAPVIYKYEQIKDKNYIKWNNSSSSDIFKTYIICETTTIDTLLAFENDEIVEYIDSSLNSNTKHCYYLLVSDISGNETRSNKVCMQFNNMRNVVELKAKVNKRDKVIELFWEELADTITKVVIYKTDKAGKLRLYRTISGSEYFFIDNKVMLNQEYRYKLKFYFKNHKTRYSSIITVNF